MYSVTSIDGLKVVLPPTDDDQGAWCVGIVTPLFVAGEDNRRWHERTAYRLLMWLHDKSESLWHWCYRVSRRFAPPPAMRDVTTNVGTYGFTGGQCVKLSRED